MKAKGFDRCNHPESAVLLCRETEAELKVFHRYLNNASNYLEFGSGLSTIYASQLDNLKTVTTVESSIDYVQNNLLTDENIKKAVREGKLNFNVVSIGETKEWGYPIDTSCKHLWPNYSLSVFNSGKEYDLVLIDGRFRVACALASLITTPDTTLLCVHDFWNRPVYHIILKYLNIEDEVETLGVFSKKRDIDRDEVQMLIKNYMFYPE